MENARRFAKGLFVLIVGIGATALFTSDDLDDRYILVFVGLGTISGIVWLSLTPASQHRLSIVRVLWSERTILVGAAVVLGAGAVFWSIRGDHDPSPPLPVEYSTRLPLLYGKAELNALGQTYDYIIRVEPDGAEQRLTSTGRDKDPRWTPDGRQILFTSDRDLPYKSGAVFVMSADGSNQRRIVSAGDGAYHPSMSPDRRDIAIGKADGLYAVLVSDQAPARRLTPEGFGDASYPRWSPDGRELVFLHDGFVFIVDRNGDNLRLLWDDVESPSYGPYRLAWSRTGKQIGISVARETIVLDRNGKEIQRIPFTEAGNADSACQTKQYWRESDFDQWSSAVSRYIGCLQDKRPRP